ncbi:MAG TPA: rRNA maturation RNase YbeY [Methylomirabilota bacterium]|nr:rRNA maturation RNase YbeY [Methylomirabilota bacterium]
MTSELRLRNRQRTRAVDLRRLHRLVRHLLREHLACAQFELGLHLVTGEEMARVNEQFLGHAGSTDVITFDHREGAEGPLYGELFVSVDDAVSQARSFRTTWPSELIRYIIHGLLHLRGHDDQDPAARRVMKREENRLLRALAREFELAAIARRPTRLRSRAAARRGE